MEQIILFAPLIGSLIAGFGWRLTSERGAQWITTGLLFVACFFSWIVFLIHGSETQHINIARWISSTGFWKQANTLSEVRLKRLIGANQHCTFSKGVFQRSTTGIAMPHHPDMTGRHRQQHHRHNQKRHKCSHQSDGKSRKAAFFNAVCNFRFVLAQPSHNSPGHQ